MENFSGFKPAIEACQLTWEDYPIPGVTYSSKDGQRWHYRFSSKFHDGGDVKKPSRVQPVTVCSEDIISTDNSRNLAQAQRSHELRSRAGRIEARGAAVRRDSCVNDGAASSGSEGFCESENRRSHDSDSSCDNPKGFHSRSNSLDESEVMLADAAAVNCQELSPGSQDHQDAEVFDENADGGSAVAKTSSPVAVVGQALQASGAKAQDLIAAPHPPDLSAKDSSQSLVAGSRASHEPSSESQQSSDEYQLYFYDTKVKVGDIEKRKKDKTDEPNLFSGLKKMENVQDVSIIHLHAWTHTHSMYRSINCMLCTAQTYTMYRSTDCLLCSKHSYTLLTTLLFPFVTLLFFFLFGICCPRIRSLISGILFVLSM